MSCILCARLIEGTGNYITAHRLLNILQQIGFEGFLVNTDEISEEEIIDQVSSQNDGSICVWFHAFRAGRFLNSIPENLDRTHIVILGGTDVNEMMKNPDRAPIIREALGRADAIAAFSPSMFERVPQEFQEKCLCIPQAVVTSSESSFNLRQEIDVDDSTFLILQVAGFRPVKDPSFAVDTVCARENSAFVIIGAHLDEELTQSMKTLEKSWSNLYIFDVMPHEDLLQCICQSDCALNTSLSEGMCNFILESMALDTPVVARRNEGNQNLLEGGCGLLFDTEEELTACLDEMQASPQEYVEKAKEKIGNSFSEEAEIQEYRNLLQKLDVIQSDELHVVNN